MESRRPIKARDTRWAAQVAGFLAGAGVKPNQISVASAVFAAGAGLCLWFTDTVADAEGAWLFLAAAIFIQLRLLCNLFDGMVAVEGGFKTKSGEIFNELPDRLADAFIFIGAGYASIQMDWSVSLGWLCALLAILTAYVRALGVSAGASQHFCGPMAKQHRMAVMTFFCLLAAVSGWIGFFAAWLGLGLAVIALGCVFTVIRRTVRIIRELEAK